jgi:hypothetical protein
MRDGDFIGGLVGAAACGGIALVVVLLERGVRSLWRWLRASRAERSNAAPTGSDVPGGTA